MHFRQLLILCLLFFTSGLLTAQTCGNIQVPLGLSPVVEGSSQMQLSFVSEESFTEAGTLHFVLNFYGLGEDDNINLVLPDGSAATTSLTDAQFIADITIPAGMINVDLGQIIVNTLISGSQCVAFDVIEASFTPISGDVCPIAFPEEFYSSCDIMVPEDCGEVYFQGPPTETNPGILDLRMLYLPGGEGTFPLQEVIIVVEVSSDDPDFEFMAFDYNGFTATVTGNTITYSGLSAGNPDNVFGQVSANIPDGFCMDVEIISATAIYPGGVSCDLGPVQTVVTTCEISTPEDCGLISLGSGFELTDESSLTYSVNIDLLHIPDYPYSLAAIDILLTTTTGTVQSEISLFSDDFSISSDNGTNFQLQAEAPFSQDAFSALVEFSNTVPNECLNVAVTSARLLFADGYFCDVEVPAPVTQSCISGEISLASCLTEFPSALESMVIVAIGANDETAVGIPNSSGGYGIAPLQLQDYTVAVDISSLPQAPNLLAAITTQDILLITRHILGISVFNTNWQMLAGDVDLNQDVTTDDIVALRRNILNHTSGFPAHPSSSGAWIAPSTINGFNDNVVPDFTTTYSQTYTGQGVSNLDFSAIELGNLNPTECVQDGADDTSVSHGASYSISDQSFKAGESVKIPVSVTNFNKLSVLDFAFQYDTKAITLKAVSSGDLQMVHNETYNINEGLGTVRGIWFPETMAIAQAPRQSRVDFYLEITAYQEIKNLSDVLHLLEGGEYNRIYPLQVKEEKVIESSGAAIISSDLSSQSINWLKDYEPMATSLVTLVSANPFIDQLTFSLNSPRPQTATVQLFSLTGKVAATQTVQLEAGKNQFQLGNLGHLSAGAYTYRILDNRGYSSVGKIIKQ